MKPHCTRLFQPFLLFLFLVVPTAIYAQTDTESCLDCHDDPELVTDDERPVGVSAERFAASMHGDFDCIDCHAAPGDYEDFPHYAAYVPVDCAECHEDAGEDYNHSVHRAGRGRNGKIPATCTGCHGSHYIATVTDTASMVHHRNIPNLCGQCHAAEGEMTKDFVRLPIAVPSYLASVHGLGWKEGKKTAVCTDCHGAHDSRIPQDPESHINRRNVSETCGQCHATIATEYDNSIHGKAVALGIVESPTCTDCHNEHLIQPHLDPKAKVSPEHRAQQVCGNCHTDPALIAKFGIPSGVVESYLDSYHGWAVDRGSQLAATCTDCHMVHEIRSQLDPMSSVHDDNVTATCAGCHKGANASFAASYTHASALEARAIHGWVRLLYLGLIAVVLGGMALHNFIVARFELLKHFSRRRREPYVVRWRRAERVQHLALLLSFSGLAITGFALRYPNSWWASLIGLGGHEAVRANLHRAFGLTMLAAAIYHMIWIFVTRRGRLTLGGITPKVSDAGQALQNMAFHLGLRKERPAFGAFDYTQKAEYWAVVWGTWIMAFTGFVLWYPTVATQLMPTWIVRVSEVIHFYEAALAVSAIVIWHFFYVIFMPSEYPMSTIWLNGRMPASEWKEMHGGEYDQVGGGPVEHPKPCERGGSKRKPAEDAPNPSDGSPTKGASSRE
jgi:cytochrome b subunit of formate dehydrogenase